MPNPSKDICSYRQKKSYDTFMKYVYGACITNDENTVLFLGYAQSVRSGYVTQGLTLCHSVTTYNYRTFQGWNLVISGFIWKSWVKGWRLLRHMNHELTTFNPLKKLARINHTMKTKFCVKLKLAYNTQIACKLWAIIAFSHSVHKCFVC